jgi:hypothetical protein
MTRRNQPPRDPEQEHRAEAARLRCVDRDTQRQIIAIHRNTAENRKLPKEDRDFARQRADALERILGLTPTGRKPSRPPRQQRGNAQHARKRSR